jgi:hydrogenase expression/formation protein HypE
MSKFSFDVLQKRVFPHMVADDADIILGSEFGEDVALTRVGGDVLVSHVDPIVGAIGNIGWLAVHVACNDIAASGVPPRWILVLVLVPHAEDEALLEQIMRDVARASREVHVSIIGGHTGYSSGLSRPLVAVTALGTASGREPVRTAGARIGDQVLVTKGIALEGTAILAVDFVEDARTLGLTEQELAQARQLAGEVSIVPEAMAIAAGGVTAMHDVTRGGLLETLLEIAYRSQVGIEIEVARIPSRPIVARFAQAFRFDPLRMLSSGTLVATVPPQNVRPIQHALEQLGIVSAIVGQVASGEGVHLVRAGKSEHHTGIRSEDDELARLWAVRASGGMHVNAGKEPGPAA